MIEPTQTSPPLKGWDILGTGLVSAFQASEGFCATGCLGLRSSDSLQPRLSYCGPSALKPWGSQLSFANPANARTSARNLASAGGAPGYFFREANHGFILGERGEAESTRSSGGMRRSARTPSWRSAPDTSGRRRRWQMYQTASGTEGISKMRRPVARLCRRGRQSPHAVASLPSVTMPPPASSFANRPAA